MRAREIFEAVFMKSAFSSRNVSTILLVTLFFGVYVAAGGRVRTSIPSPSGHGGEFESFGGTIVTKPTSNAPDKKDKQTPTPNLEKQNLAPFGEVDKRSLGIENSGKEVDRDELADEPVVVDNDINPAASRLSALQDRLNKQRAKGN